MGVSSRNGDDFAIEIHHQRAPFRRIHPFPEVSSSPFSAEFTRGNSVLCRPRPSFRGVRCVRLAHALARSFFRRVSSSHQVSLIATLLLTESNFSNPLFLRNIPPDSFQVLFMAGFGTIHPPPPPPCGRLFPNRATQTASVVLKAFTTIVVFSF